MAFTISTTARNAAADAVTALVSGGTLEVYSGSKPASPATAATGTLLATFTLATPAFAAAVTGTADLDADPDLSTTGAAAGDAGWFRIKTSSGTATIDGTAGTSGTDLVLNSTAITVGATVTIISGSITMPA